MTDIDGLLRRAGASALKKLLRSAVDNYRFGKMEANLRPVMPVRAANQLLKGLSPQEITGLESYLASPDFEQVMLHVIVERSRPKREADDGSIREELRHGLRLHASLSGENGYALTDLMLSAITAAVEQSGAPQAVQGQDLAGMAHRATLAVRNSELLHLVPSLAAFHEQAEAMRGQVAKLHGELRLPHAGVSRSAPWSQLYVAPRLDGLSIDKLTEPGQRSVILGDPGAGKSTLARWLSYRIAADERPGVPFLVILRDLSEHLRVGERTLEEYLPGVARNPYNIAFSVEAVRYLLLNGRAVVILDGLDELTDLSLRQRVVDLVDGFAQLHPLVPIVVTSRRIGYAEAPLRSPAFRTYTVEPFDEDRVEAYARNWFTLDDGTPPHERASLCEAFVRDSAAITELRSNPLLLALLCAMYRNERYIPSNRAQVYERCALMLFEQWDSMRGIKMLVRFEGRVRGAVQELAWQMYAERQTPALPRSKVLGVIARFLVTKEIDDDLAQQMATDFLEFCAGRAWVLAEVGAFGAEPLYGFAHKTFLEFFAAEHLVRCQVTPEKVWEVLATRPLADSSWTVIGQIALHLLERNVLDGAENLVLAALTNPGCDLAQCSITADFLVRACAELPIAPGLVKRVVRLAYDCAIPIPMRLRAPVLFELPIVLSDSALATIIWSAPDSPNAREIVKELASLLGEAILARDDAGCYLAEWLLVFLDDVLPTPPPIGEAVKARLGVEHDDARRHWREGSLAFHALKAQNLQALDDVVRTLGVAPFYLGARFGDYVLRPVALLGLEDRLDDEAFRLRDHLMRAETPWLSADYSRDLIGKRHLERRFNDSQHNFRKNMDTRIILLLPYLEAMARNDSFDPGVLAPPLLSHLIGARRRRRSTVRIPNSKVYFVEFIRRWVAGEFDVLG